MPMLLRADVARSLTHEELDANFKACLGVHNLLHIQERINPLGSGAALTLGAWRTRTLNAVVTNTIPGASFDSVTYRFTLPAGNYFLFGRSQAYKVDYHAARIYDPINMIVYLSGTGQRSYTDDFTGNFSELNGAFTLPNVASFELQHRGTATHSAGMGSVGGADFGQAFSVLSEVLVWKLS